MVLDGLYKDSIRNIIENKKCTSFINLIMFKYYYFKKIFFYLKKIQIPYCIYYIAVSGIVFNI